MARTFHYAEALLTGRYRALPIQTSWPRGGARSATLPRDQIEFDVRPSGYQRWIEVSASEPGLPVHIYVDITDVADGELLEGVMSEGGWLEAFAKLDATLQGARAGSAAVVEVTVWPS